jgi:predicted DNA-binding transcriptional regulator YafY
VIIRQKIVILPPQYFPMNRIDRLFGILTLLQSKKYVTADKIAAKYKISVRTVYRDIRALEEQGVPVSFEQPHGYYIVDGFFLPPVSFTSDEANALLLMESIVKAFSDQSIRTHYSSALQKVHAVMRTSQKENLSLLADRIKLQVPPCLNLGDYEYLSMIQQAITDAHVLEIGYKNSKDEISKRKLEPIGLVFYALNWHLIGWCHLRKDYRDFRISRISSMKNTELPFTQKSHIPLAEYMKQLPVEY